MKKSIYFLFLFGLLLSCDPKQKTDIFVPDPNAMILIRPAKGVQLRSSVPDLTALEIVQKALAIKWQSHWFCNTYWDIPKDIGRSFPEQQKDYEKPALLMLGIDVISFDYNEDGILYDYLYKDFIYGYNVFITDNAGDTIAYVPDAVINEARPLIESAYADGNYTEVYRLFNEAFTFLPMPSE